MDDGASARGAVDGIALLGFGEAAESFAGGWTRERRRVATYDLKLDDPALAALLRRRAETVDVVPLTRDQALRGAAVVLSLVTADRVREAAAQAAPHLSPGALYIDGNSCSPGTKADAAAAVRAAGARYVDMAIMAPVRPRRHLTPVLLSGPDAAEALGALEALGMQPRLAGPLVGQASAVKMVRSVMIKGLEALVAECFLTARRAGVDEAVLASLEASDPDIRWRERGAYALDRMMVHGTRRAAEMREVATTVEDAGLPARLARATVEWQAAIGALSLDPGDAKLEERLDRILSALG
jgi:3-hydroxyisobutyrate dehydrogenase-like beta-hydroxyacid dehydrogenase